MHELISQLKSAEDLRSMQVSDLERLADEIRGVLCHLLSDRTAHFASNLGVVELCLALHSVFDFRSDRLIWDTGHQVYPHKLVTGRFDQFTTIRTRNGLMGYPNPNESEYDLFMTGHAGCSLSTALGLKCGDDLRQHTDRHSVAVIGDGAFSSGIVFEALNNAGGLEKNLLVILNDNKMSICPRVGGMGSYLDRLRTNAFYTGLKSEVVRILNHVPLFGDPTERFLAQMKEAVKAGLYGGMMFEDLGFRYIGPIDGHNIGLLRKYLKMVKSQKGPILLHIVTEKGHGFQPAAEDPVFFHTPPAFEQDNGKAIPKPKKSAVVYTDVASKTIREEMARDDTITVLTAAMCQGNKLEDIRDTFPDRFFDTGICESHAVAFAAGLAKAGLRPIVDIYSTFLQRSFDQIFQEVALQNLPVTFMMDRAGLTGPDGPTHHGVFDIAYMRMFPNLIVMAPGDSHDLQSMVRFATRQTVPCSIRYPKATADYLSGDRAPLELGKSEVLRWGQDGFLLCCGTLASQCLQAAESLEEEGLRIGVANARFVKPIDRDLIAHVLGECTFVATVEESALMGGFGSAVLEAACDAGLETEHVHRIGIGDAFVEHGGREELLAELGLTAEEIAKKCRQLATSASTLDRP